MATKSSKRYEYYIARVPGSDRDFTVAKFDSMEGGEQPLAVYNVRYDKDKQSGKCNCHAAVYRGTGSNDKHVLMVRQWIIDGEKTTAILA